MSTALRRGLRRLRRLVALALALLLITAAVIVGVGAQLLPVLERHPGRVEAWLSARIGQSVEISALSARWSRRGPLLDLEGLRIGGGPAGGGVDVGQARLRINVYAGLLPGQPLLSLRVEGLRLELARNAEGRWRVRGLRGGAGVDIEQALAQLERIGDLELHGGKLVVEDRFADVDLVLERIDARLRTLGGRFRFALRVHGADDSPLQLVADFDTLLQSGKARLWGRGLDLPGWLQGSTFEGLGLAGGSAEVDAWMEVEAGRLHAVSVELDAEGLALQADVDGVGAVPAPLRLSAVWEQIEAGWKLDVHELRVGDRRARPVTRARAEAVDGQIMLAVDSVDVAALTALAAWWPDLAAPQRQWLIASAPTGRLRDLGLIMRDDRIERLELQVDGLAVAAVAAAPGFSGLDLRLRGDSEGWIIEVDSPDFEFDAPASLAAPIRARLDAELAAWPEAGGLRVDVGLLRVRGEDFGAQARGGLSFGGARTRPRLDLYARVDDSPIAAAHRFWVRNRMPPRTVEWLQRALIEGQVVGGEAVIAGELDDWPFDQTGGGRLQARARVEDVVLDYLPEWPRGERLSGSVDFVNDSMQAEVSARVSGVEVRRARGRIADFSEPVLELELAGGGQGPQLLGLLRASPLWSRFGEAMRGLSVGGRGQVELDIRAPLKRELGELQLNGQVDLVDADLVDSQWGLRFAAATGRLRFNERGFSADELGVRFDGQPGSLSLAAGDSTAVESHAFEATLRGAFSTDSLLATRPELHWLEPYLLGRGQWNIELSVPERGSSQRSRLRVGSSLQGVAIRLPSPLRKPASATLPLQLEVQLPATEPYPGGSVALRLGQLLQLHAQPGEGPAQFRGRAIFGAGERGSLPARGLEVQGRVPVLDAVGWLGLGMGFAGGNEGLVLGSVQLEAGAVAVGERLVSELAVVLGADSGQGRRLQLSSADIEGVVDWPAGFERPLQARFERLHWPAGSDDAESTARPAATRRAMVDLDPTMMPALDVEIADFGFGSGRLGALRLKTRRGADGQLVEELSTRSPDLKVDIRGDWSRTLEGSESRFSIGFEGDDLGRMLSAFGLPSLVEGGATRADMDLRWRGGPANFAFAAADGQLRLSVGRGRLPELDPGAGRLLGLLSLAEIPRRLALDFSDFFRSGFGFNGIEGSFVLATGSAVTEDLRIDAPAAEIRMRGRAGLAARDYDLQVEVLPRTGSVLPALGAITAGPAGAAVGAVAQAVLQQPMKQFNRTLYQLDGGWDEPRIEVVERGPARPESSPRPPLRESEPGRSSPASG
ncbi:MAG: TIGR02099 family protein [Aquimonas sp.]|nr:TIGR02099 family protein [Aquimonas sp.]